jgi:hypothetical protein
MWYFALAIVRFLVEMMFFGNIVGGVGARASAIYFSLVETAKANGLEPYDSLCRAPAANPLRADRRGLGSVAALEYEIEKIPNVRIRRFFGAYPRNRAFSPDSVPAYALTTAVASKLVASQSSSALIQAFFGFDSFRRQGCR